MLPRFPYPINVRHCLFEMHTKQHRHFYLDLMSRGSVAHLGIRYGFSSFLRIHSKSSQEFSPPVLSR